VTELHRTHARSGKKDNDLLWKFYAPFRIISLAALLGLTACNSTPSPLPLTASPTRSDTTLTVETEGQQALIHIHSPGGIGGAAIEITSAQRPEKITLRFYLHGLEELRFTYADTLITASVASTGEHNISQMVRQASQPEQPLSPDSPFWLKIRLVTEDGSPGNIPLPNGYIEVEAPPDFIQSQEGKFAIEWIDFYR